eukprot:scaffold7431_cov219-Ochromonas_danica.AAC.2
MAEHWADLMRKADWLDWCLVGQMVGKMGRRKVGSWADLKVYCLVDWLAVSKVWPMVVTMDGSWVG